MVNSFSFIGHFNDLLARMGGLLTQRPSDVKYCPLSKRENLAGVHSGNLEFWVSLSRDPSQASACRVEGSGLEVGLVPLLTRQGTSGRPLKCQPPFPQSEEGQAIRRGDEGGLRRGFPEVKAWPSKAPG